MATLPPIARSPGRGKKAEPAKVLSAEEAEACTKRLYEASMEAARRKEEKRRATLAQVPGRLPPKLVHAADIEALTQRMYDKQIEHKRLRAAEAEKKRDKAAAIAPKQMSEEEVADSVNRMYTQQREIKAVKMAKLTKQFHPAPERKTINKEQVAALGDRLSKEWLARKEESKKRIFNKYVAPLDPVKHTITPDELAAMASRLCTTKGKAA
jgi:hypothetical protein